ncbi:ArsI/CadI family heavy metal resistance metalloenzyme [Legionella pneumophila]|jgi:catechol 2,3-dioxygenase-like lactoylglutathione lyase family enzyme|uniref:ArsI/CadI family heavy metal resistance metalloenzyme n=1 Tax=Legionella pneumophila TaxID=446 RepID=UPI0002C15825|nr:ArsI/CadI family heavy metal resistance metalloenzyme [Legionella pneumophila]AGH55346.1 Glyoxalase [Legionella pneumophila subsp. pneumophila LPE509]MCW8442402.1 VOC family protein [Legionella pneumophila]
MKRFHIHIGVDNLADSIRFYNALFGADPVKVKSDYAKWMLDDPRINFAISTRGKQGVEHLGIQVDDATELEALRKQFSRANISTHSDGETTCCYAKSEKSWVSDPSGIAWEAYHTMEDAQFFSGEKVAESSCSMPDKNASTACCDTKSKTSGCCG